MSDSQLLQCLAEAIGAEAVITDPDRLAPSLTDWRGRYHGSALALLRPRDTAGVAAAVRLCTGQGVAIVPQGGNTGLVGGATPDGGRRSVVLSTLGLRQVRAVDPSNDTITVEAGCRLAEVQQAAAAAGRLFPLSLAAEGSCTIGGNLSTNAGGTQVLRYGNARELTLGLEVVLPDGQVWDGLRGLRKDNAGYDLKQLFVGAEGTLGVITAATLRLFPAVRSRVTAWVAVRDVGAAIALLARARAHAGGALTAFELLSRDCVELVRRAETCIRMPFPVAHPWVCLVEWSDQDRQEALAERAHACLAEALDAGEALDVSIATGSTGCEAAWRVRESIPAAQARAGGNVKHDISLPVDAYARFLDAIGAGLHALEPRLLPLVFGHLGDGNLHCNVGVREGVDPALAFAFEEAINAIVYEQTVRAGGSVSAEHGLGQLRRDLAARVKDPVSLALMRSIKQALDPRGLMNPGKVLA